MLYRVLISKGLRLTGAAQEDREQQLNPPIAPRTAPIRFILVEHKFYRPSANFPQFCEKKFFCETDLRYEQTPDSFSHLRARDWELMSLFGWPMSLFR